MEKYCVLFNPLSNNGNGAEEARRLDAILGADQIVYRDITAIADYRSFFASLPLSSAVVLCGGDGTLNRFANAIRGMEITHEISYFPCGSGNDFWRDLGEAADRPVVINTYLQNLPSVTVKGKEYRFLNGVGYGIDGYCCEVGDRMRRETPQKKINYASIAISGLLRHYSPKRATVTVDGVEHVFEKAWLAPTMFGKYYGGGMMATPNQDRNAKEQTISVLLFHGAGRIKTLSIFPSIFKGEHVKHKKQVAILTGKEIHVRFDQPASVQIDGETITDVTEYSASVHSTVLAKAK
jgi:diacylglycerol kinase family enzyme